MIRLCVAVCFSVIALIAAPAALAKPNDAVSFETPFELRDNKLLIEIEIDGRTLRGVYDNGAEASAISTSAAEALRLSVPSRRRANVIGAGGSTQGFVLRDQDIAVGGAKHRFSTLIAFDLAQLWPISGWPFDFILGLDAFPNHVAEIDPQAAVIRWTPRAAFTPPEGATASPMTRREGLFHTVVSVNGVEVETAIDTGAAEAIAISPQLAERAGIDASASASFGGAGVGGTFDVRMTSAREVTFGGVTFTDVPVRLERGLQVTEVEANVGYLLMRQYRMIFDYAGERFWAVPIADPATATFPRDMGGLVVERPSPDRLTVRVVSDRGPAHDAGLQVGAEITAIDGVAIADWPQDRSIRAWATGAEGTERTLSLADGRTVTLRLRRYY